MWFIIKSLLAILLITEKSINRLSERWVYAASLWDGLGSLVLSTFKCVLASEYIVYMLSWDFGGSLGRTPKSYYLASFKDWYPDI